MPHLWLEVLEYRLAPAPHTSDTGLRVTAEVNRQHYQTGIKVTTAQMRALKLEP